jgi:E3 ubiquitin-protein ligase DOA10
MSVAHEHCLAQWIRRLIDVNTKIRARCEVCDAEFNYKITHERIFDLNELKMNY